MASQVMSDTAQKPTSSADTSQQSDLSASSSEKKAATKIAHTKQIYGYIEKVTLVDYDLTLSAKLDTGAQSASLNATHITEKERDGKTYLAFIVPSKEGDIQCEAEYVGEVLIKSRAGELGHPSLQRTSLKRPVVLMRVKLGDKERVIRVNLTNRKRFIYPLLLGRDAINTFGGMIDPNQTFTIKHGKADGNARP